LEAAGADVTFRGILWHQGEQDARAVDEDEITRMDYRRAFRAMIAKYRSIFGATLPFWIFELGRPATGDTPGFKAIRSIQNEIAAEEREIHIVSRKQRTFPDKGCMRDELHYNQEGFDVMGREGATGVLGILE
jgi:hypothetical protein